MESKQQTVPTNRDDQPVKRLPKVKVGDMLQYRYYFTGFGTTNGAQTTREVIAIHDGGARFVVQGGFYIEAKNVMTHIPMHNEEEESAAD